MAPFPRYATGFVLYDPSKAFRLLGKTVDKILETYIFKAADKTMPGIWPEPITVNHLVLEAFTEPQGAG